MGKLALPILLLWIASSSFRGEFRRDGWIFDLIAISRLFRKEEIRCEGAFQAWKYGRRGWPQAALFMKYHGSAISGRKCQIDDG